MKTIIHVGYPKTGSTWFQNILFPNIQNVTVIDKKEIKNDFMLTNSLTFDKNKLKNKYLKYYEENPLLISNELLIGGSMHTGGLNGIFTTEFANRLYAVFPEATIIIFIRNQFSHIASAYNQYIRGGGNLGINKYLFQDSFKALNKFFFFSFSFLEFDKTISYYKKTFGADKVHVFLFEDFKNNPKKFTEEFVKIFDFEVNIDKLDYSPINTSFRRYIKPIFRTVNLLYKRAVIHKKSLFNFDNLHETVKYRLNNWNDYQIFGPFDTSKKILGRKNYDFISKYYRESNKKLLTEHHLTRITQYNYPL